MVTYMLPPRVRAVITVPVITKKNIMIYRQIMKKTHPTKVFRKYHLQRLWFHVFYFPPLFTACFSTWFWSPPTTGFPNLQIQENFNRDHNWISAWLCKQVVNMNIAHLFQEQLLRPKTSTETTLPFTNSLPTLHCSLFTQANTQIHCTQCSEKVLKQTDTSQQAKDSRPKKKTH